MATTQVSSRNRRTQRRGRVAGSAEGGTAQTRRVGRIARTNGRFGIDDLTYDLVTMLQQKSTGLQAYQRYIDDARANGVVRKMLERFRKDDLQKVQELRECLGDVLGADTHRH